MRHLRFALILSFTLFFTLTVLAGVKAPENLHTAIKNVKFYVSSGAYEYGLTKVAEKAHHYLANQIRLNKLAKNKRKLAMVLDIDETSLSNYPYMLKTNFSGLYTIVMKGIEQGDDPAIKSTLELYNYAKANNVAVFFVTGRKENLRALTIKNLEAAGYKNWNALMLKPNTYNNPSAVPYKSAMRKKIESEGYDIVLNIGDQYSDLEGGYADRIYKLPDPFYYIP